MYQVRFLTERVDRYNVIVVIGRERFPADWVVNEYDRNFLREINFRLGYTLFKTERIKPT